MVRNPRETMVLLLEAALKEDLLTDKDVEKICTRVRKSVKIDSSRPNSPTVALSASESQDVRFQAPPPRPSNIRTRRSPGDEKYSRPAPKSCPSYGRRPRFFNSKLSATAKPFVPSCKSLENRRRFDFESQPGLPKTDPVGPGFLNRTRSAQATPSYKKENSVDHPPAAPRPSPAFDKSTHPSSAPQISPDVVPMGPGFGTRGRMFGSPRFQRPPSWSPRKSANRKYSSRFQLRSPGGTYYRGKVKSFSEKDGYGFIECADVKKLHGGDVFLHKNQFHASESPLSRNDDVFFRIEMNAEGKPQARDVQAAQF